MPLTLAKIFSSHMVLQRDAAVPVWGGATPGAEVSVSFAGQTRQAVAQADGRWQVTLDALPASAKGQRLTVTATHAGHSQQATCDDVLVGDVWLGSGQSNMDMQVCQVKDAPQEIDAADHPAIRLFKVDRRIADKPLADLGDDQTQWQVCSPTSIPTFSAVAYFFGRQMQRELDVPVGLIHSAWGGTVIEAWISQARLHAQAIDTPLVARSLAPQAIEQARAAWDQVNQAILQRTRDTGDTGHARGWAGDDEPADGGWRDIELPCYWQAAGLEINGVVWFRRQVELPQSWAGHDLQLSLGSADKSDTTYFNNQRVGGISSVETPNAWNIIRQYTVPGHLVKAGVNTVAVRVHSDRFGGGLPGPAAAMTLRCPSVPHAPTIPLDGRWRCAVETSYGKVVIPPEPHTPDNPNWPANLHNGMLRALAPYALRGFLWYQGEGNASMASHYRHLQTLLIEDLRAHWQDDAARLPFYFVQLANYKTVLDTPDGDSAWARLREAQAATLAVPNTGMAVTIDIGERNDIHPRNKQEVGRRLALAALHQTFGRADLPPGSPLFKAATRQGDAIAVTFDHVDGGLATRDGQPVAGFAIAGQDKRFIPAQAVIDAADRVVVRAAGLAEPAFVRYGWQDDPACNLASGAGLPVSPFRTDVD